MKNLRLKLTGTFAISLLSVSTFAQNWQQGGNGAFPPAWNVATPANQLLGTTTAFPLRIITSNVERMRITPTGEVGIGQTIPLSFLHLNSNGNTLAGQVFRTTSLTDGYWKMFTGAGNGVERFRLYTQTNNNVFFETTTQNAIYGIRTGNIGTQGLRFLVNGQASTNPTSGRIAIGNNLPENFTILDRLHLHHDVATLLRIRYTHLGTGNTATDGFAHGLETNGDFRFTQMELNPIDTYTPQISMPTNQVLRYRIDANGQVYVGNQNETENVMYGAPNAFSQSHTSLFNVSGPINSCARIDQNNPLRTILYAYTTPYGNPGLGAQDGFRMKANLNYRNSFIDALVFEKTEAAQADPDGYIAFTNTGNDSLEEVSFYIDGKGRTYVGHTIDSTINNRLTIESDTLIDASRSGLRFVNLTSTDPTVPNPGIGVLALDSMGNVILVSQGSTYTLCGDTVNGKLQGDSKTDLNNHNFYFVDRADSLNLNYNRVAVGISCGDTLIAKFSVKLDHSVDTSSLGGYFHNHDEALVGSAANTSFTALHAITDRSQTLNNTITHIGAHFEASGAKNNYGFKSYAFGGRFAYGGKIEVNGSPYYNLGLQAYVNGGVYTVGSNFRVFGGSTTTAAIIATAGASSGTGTSYGIYASANSANGGAAGYFSGQIVAGGVWLGSDEQFKRELRPTENILNRLARIKTYSYLYKTAEYAQFNFDEGIQYGVLAQEFKEEFPELVQEKVHPGEIDSLGNVITQPTTFLAVNYVGAIPLVFQGLNEVNQKVEKQTLSDQSLKTNVVNLDGTESLNKLLALRGVSYQWDYQNHPEFDFDSTENIGLIAQEVNAVDPRLTYIDELGLMHVKYDKLTPVIIEAITVEHETNVTQDSVIETLNLTIASQQATIDSLKNSVSQFQNEFNQFKACMQNMFPNMCEVNQGMIQNNSIQQQEQIKSTLDVTLSNRNSVILSQNVPNPFAESTTIEYNIPITVKHAQIQFYDMQGKLIQTVDLTERGKGSINVFANDLSSGIYTYSLVADGKVEASKKMMKK